MTASSTPLSICQLRVVLRGISPLIWRRLLVHSETTLAPLHTILQIVLAWSDEHLYGFYVHGMVNSTIAARPMVDNLALQN